ncbi:MAG: ribose 5-phosphate isomerase B [Alphaproteobacteria bacterium GM202ARS2]|nr:ribose 5-phosphate isomerase B [Alphaproteobacteria bacterium GM202ARS2]
MDKVVAIGCDHAGYSLKRVLCAFLQEQGYALIDVGTDGAEQSVDYGDYAHRVAEHVQSGKAGWGVLVCGSGLGMCMAANRHRGVRAACCHDVVAARYARLHNNANVLTLGERLVGVEVAKACLQEFLRGSFEGGRHMRRIEGIET